MTEAPEYSAGSVELAHGRLSWSADGAVSILTPHGERAVPGDGVAADLVALLCDEPVSNGILTARPEGPITAFTGVESGLGDDVDMLNWNVVVDNRLIVKVVRRLGSGDRAARLMRSVLGHAPHAVPALHGTIEITTSHGPHVVAIVTEFLPGSVDGWTWMVDDALQALEHGTPSAWPAELGALVAATHGALYRETASEPPYATDGGRAGVDELRALLDDDDVSPRLRARHQALRSALQSLPATTAPTFAIHGDLHMGQVLRDRSGAMKLIDFDGDPQGGVDSEHADAAVDLAHLMMSLDMVGAVVAKRLGADNPRILAWCDDARAGLLNGYRDAANRLEVPFLLDESRLPGLHARRVIREFTYARDYLPRWGYSSDWAVTHRYEAAPNLKDYPWTPPDSATI
jgi:maltokinase